MQRIPEDTQICHAILRGKSNQQLFEEEIQKMKILDVAANIRTIMNVQVLAYCVLDNELHLLMQMPVGQSADAFLDSIARRYEETCLHREGILRIDYLPEQNRFPKVNSSVHEQGFFYSANQKIQHFRKNTIKEIASGRAILSCWLKLHMLPVRQGIVRNPEDYWWCSYLDYMGRQWIPLADTSEILSQFSDDPKQAAKLIRKRHQKALEKIPSIK